MAYFQEDGPSDESVYQLVEEVAQAKQKGKRYKSKHNPKTAPTATTFGLNNTGRPGMYYYNFLIKILISLNLY